MIDLAIGAALALLVIRGWYRGFVREALDLAGLVLGIVVAFRFSPLVGDVLADMTGISEDSARFVAGALLFLAVGIGAAIAARALEHRARLPGLNLINRAWGAGIAAAWGLFVSTLLLSLLTVLPMPSAVSTELEDSAVTRALTDPEGAPQQVFERLSGDGMMQTVLNLREAIGARRAVVEEGDAITFPPASPDRLAPDPDSARDVFDLLNRARVEAGLDPLAWSDALAEVGADHAYEMYLTGVFAHRSDTTGTAADRLDAAGVSYLTAGENLALAATPAGVHRGLMGSPGHRANILRREYRRAGVAVIDGPLGLMTVQVFTG